MLIEAIERADTIAVGGHVRPDGDCVGSAMGLYLYVKEHFPEKKITVYLESIPDTLRFMKDSDEIKNEIPEDGELDLFVALDCGDMGRLGFSRPLMEQAKHTFCVDHHISNQSFAEENVIVPDASSTSELIFNLLDYERISKWTAECLYTGIVHDTGVFRYSCTHPSTMRAAASLMEKGIDFSSIVTKTFDEKTYIQNKVLGKCLLDSKLLCNNRVIVSSISRNEMEEYQVQPKQLDGIVSQLRLTKGVDVAVFAYELEEDVHKFSFRSSEAVDVSALASSFGGGGHIRAAGCTLDGKIDALMQTVLGAVEEQLSDGSKKE